MGRRILILALVTTFSGFFQPTTLVRPLEVKMLETPVDLSGKWKYQAGDDLAWAKADYDDSSWSEVKIPAAWGQQSAADQRGFAWYRMELRLPWGADAAQQHSSLGILLGPIWCGSYEVYANGERIGGFGSFPPATRVYLPCPMPYRIPPQALGKDGRLIVAVRAWWDPLYAQTFTRWGRRFISSYALGAFDTLQDRAERDMHRGLVSDLPRLLIPILFAVVGLYHLQLYQRRRQLTEYLWFALIALSFAAFFTCLTLWTAEFGSVLFFAASARCFTHLAVLFGVQFLWPVLSRPIGSWLRAYQGLQIALMALIILRPEVVLGAARNLAFLVPILPLTVGGTILVLQMAWRGNPDARTIGLGGAVLALTQLFYVGSQLGVLPISGWYQIGFVAFVFSMMASLSNRFSRVYQELDALNRDLENKVEERTGALQTANERLGVTVEQIKLAQQETETKNEQLRQSEEKFSKFFKANPVASNIVSLSDGRVLEVNDASQKLTQFSPGEVIGRTTLELNTWVDLEARQKMFEALEEGRTPYVFETQIRTKSGGITDVFVSVELIEIASERCILGMYYNITDRKRLEAQLHQNIEELAKKNQELLQTEEKFSKFFHANPVPSTILSLPEGRLLDVNEASLKLTGFERQEVIGKTSVELNSWADDSVRPRVFQALAEGKTPHTFEAPLRTKSGDIKDVFASVELVEIGQGKCILSMFYDITERKRLETQLHQNIEELAQKNQELRQTEEKFSKFFHANPVPSTILSFAEGRLLDVNEASLKLTGFERGEVIGKTSIELNSLADDSVRPKVFQVLAEGKTPYTFEAPLRTKSGDIKDVFASVELFEIGQEKCILSMFYDITERKQLESQLHRKVEELGQKNEELVASQQQADRIFSALAQALPGTVLDGKYRLDEKIGSGGFGAVFASTHLQLNRPVAVKVFRPSSGRNSAEDVERFRREGMSACRVHHPNAISILDSGISREGIAYLVMELLSGYSLGTEMRLKRQLPFSRCAFILNSVCSALAEAHAAGIIHRDIKPDNIFLHQTRDGEVVKVVDFGIAKLTSDPAGGALQELTVTGSIIGTPTYMAPECLKGEEFNAKADVYSVGVLLYEMICGRPPFPFSGKRGVVDIMLKHINEDPPPLHTILPSISPHVEAVVLSALQKEPYLRPTVLELAEKFAKAVSIAQDHLQAPTTDLGVHIPPTVHLTAGDFKPDAQTVDQTVVTPLAERDTFENLASNLPPNYPPTSVVELDQPDETVQPTVIEPTRTVEVSGGDGDGNREPLGNQPNSLR